MAIKGCPKKLAIPCRFNIKIQLELWFRPYFLSKIAQFEFCATQHQSQYCFPSIWLADNLFTSSNDGVLSKYLVEILILVAIQKWIWLYIIWSFFIANGSKESSILVYMNQNDNEHIRLWYFKFSYKQLDQFRIQLGNFTHVESFASKLLLLFYSIQNPIKLTHILDKFEWLMYVWLCN